MPIFTCENLTKRYGTVLALDHINLNIEPGRIVGLLGPNGSGKSTMIKLANGLLTPTEGRILIDGKAPGVETKAIVSYLPERTYLADRNYKGGASFMVKIFLKTLGGIGK